MCSTSPASIGNCASQFALLLLLTIGVTCKFTSAEEPTANAEKSTAVLFEKHVRPILKAHCFQCHGEERELAGGLDLRLVHLMQSGGDSGAAIQIGSAAQSLLIQRVASQEMPPSGKGLSESERQIISAWIESGAQTARAEPKDPTQAKFTEEELSHWAFQSPNRPKIPAVDQELLPDCNEAIDRFIGAKLQQAGLRFSEPADRATMLRRLKFDLHGLPPTGEELSDYLSDENPDAYERLVDRLLASPQYGARWGRHWLDVVGYAESDGNINKDQPRPYAWYFRDYVVDAFNVDKPYDQFLLEQLAGDELVEGTLDGNNPRHVELMAATGFLRMAPDVTQTDNSVNERNQAVADMISVVGTGLLGLTVGCAQCHDHRYDPISIEDYYSLRAVFDPAFPLEQWKRPSERLMDLTDDATRATAAEIEKQAVQMQADIAQRRREHCQSIQEREIAKVPEELRESIRKAVNTKPAEQTEEQKQLLDRYPTVRTVEWIIGQLVEYDGKAHNSFEAEEKKVAEVRATKPLQRLLMTVSESREKLPVSKVFFRGSPESPTTETQPRELTALVAARNQAVIPLSSEKLPRTTGRRLAYAQQLIDGKHPTVARVLVNRVWMHHFGTGLVTTPGNFGLGGNAPSHPELLDWLAVDFMENGWSIKRLHRQILQTRAYQQSAVPEDASSFEIDHQNRLLGRASLRRLDAESVRDAILQVSGQLNLTVGGPSVPVTEDGEGKAVIGTQNRRNGLFDSVSGAGGDAFRRSVYIASLRSLPLNELQTFDLPNMTPNCQIRGDSTVAQQALFFMNDQFVVDSSMRMSESLAAYSSDVQQQIREAYTRLFAVEPTEDQLSQAKAFLERQASNLGANTDPEWKKKMGEKPELVSQVALANLCQTLMSSSRFLYVQ